MSPDNEILTIPQIAKEWGVTQRTVRNWVKFGRLATVRIEGRFRVGVRRSVAESVLGERPTATERLL